MKNLNEKLQDLKQEFRDRIKRGEFDVVNIEYSSNCGYMGVITVSIDEVIFRYSLSDDRTFIADHGELKIFPVGKYQDYFTELYRQFDLFESERKQERIKELKREIEKLEKLES